ncbi:Putative Catalytic activity: Inositol-1 [Penicillium brasilianum]|uniref:Putative Catalytic activity: Inositol-1 n=1 Tax=Penicillium brasilianum TaxID=104259 RepID=A0A0F7TYC0_PENBI|nr:Putative Catalytic activity: Inositol-1 [Penicillium brasilianum]
MSAHEQQTAPPPGSDPREHAAEDVEDTNNPGLDLQSLSRAVKARKADYTRRQSVRVKIGTWNVAAINGTEKDIGKWFVQGQGVCEQLSGLKGSQSRRNDTANKSPPPNEDGERKNDSSGAAPFQFSQEEVDLYVLGLQEIVDVSSPAEALRPYTDPGPASRWKEAVHQALPPGYQLVSEVQLLGLFLTIYASPAIRDSISSISSTYVGTGLMGYMGNKGAVATRLVLGETTRLVFVNCHLAAGSDKGSLERRNWDAMQITQRAKFEPVETEGETQEGQGDSIGEEDFTFWFGDLNYRLDDIPGDDVRQVLARHTENSYDAALQGKRPKSDSRRNSLTSDSSSENRPPSLPEGGELPEPVTDEEIDPHNDPASLQTTISSLITHDQLRIQQKKGTAFHKGWREGQISFLPTYKYDVGSVALFDTSEKHRGPSWCDRILYRTRRDRLKHEQLDREAEEARKRDKEMQARGLDKAVADDNVLFDYDPEADGQDGSVGSGDYGSDADGDADSSSSSEDAPPESIHQHQYISHQGILSSDHKPLDSIFTLTFDAVNPILKAKVHQEVVRELDKAENEARPGLTVVVDTHVDEDRSQRDPNTIEFGQIKYDVPIHRSLTVANTSGAPATFSFAERSSLGDSTQNIPPWLDIQVHRSADHEPAPGESSKSESSHTLLPGEVANIDVTAHVRSIEHVRLLNLKKAKLEEILVLHVDSGRDHFISACGKWLPTCFGCSVDELTRMPEEGARSLNDETVLSRERGANEVRLSAPRELFRLTESISDLTERAVAEWSMTKGESKKEQAPWTKKPGGSAWPFQPDTWTLMDPNDRATLLASVRESLDTNGSLSSIFAPETPYLHRLEILSETLLTFLNSLSDGIVTANVWQQMEQHMITREKSKAPSLSWEETQAWVLESLAYSPAHSVSFTFVTFMLARIANEVAPVPSTASTSNDQNRSTDETANSTNNQEQNRPSESTSIFPTPPTPAAAAAFISGGSFRRKPRLPDPEIASDNSKNAAVRRQAVESALADIFARVLISAAVPVPAKDKERRASDERRKSIIEPFLKMIGVDERGPSGGR